MTQTMRKWTWFQCMGYLCRGLCGSVSTEISKSQPFLNFLSIYVFTKLPLLLEELEPNTRTRQQRMWFQQDRALPHFQTIFITISAPCRGFK
jgi:hypothetical protein